MTRLTIIVGAGGVGKTTLAAGLAVAHARAGRRAALLGVDPAKRVRSALGLADVPDAGVAVPGAGSLAVALLDPGACLRRWVGETCADADRRARVLAHPYVVAIGERIAAFTDAIGCARAVEWVDREPDLDELVLDTAPGVSAIELLARPDKLLALFDGRVVRWLGRLARFGASGLTARGSRRLLAGLADLTGGAALRDLGELVVALDDTIAATIARLERARSWLAAPTTALVIACGVSDRAAEVALDLGHAIRALGLAPTLVALDRVLPDELATRSFGDSQAARAFGRYVHNSLRTQVRVRAKLAQAGVPVLAIPEIADLDAGDRLAALTAVGEPLRCALASPMLPVDA